jgi:aldehyde dehydrogenase (NAD+)
MQSTAIKDEFMINVKTILDGQNAYFKDGQTKAVAFRIEKLKTLKNAIVENERRIFDALKSDLNKSAYESYMTEIGIILNEIRYVINNIATWAKPEKVKTPFIHPFSTSFIYPEPYGITLIISPWNYPFQLALAPLIGSMAAGNCSVLKPSESSTHKTAIIAEIIAKNFEREYVAVVEGDLATSQALLAEKFDYIFFTGSVNVAKSVMAFAAKHLTPLTLELGGKSPCIVDREVNIDLAAKRIVSGKFINAGQTCIAPDYLIVHKAIKDELVGQIQKYIIQFYGPKPQYSSDYPRIINNRHFERLVEFLDIGNILFGGQTDQENLYISPTLLDNITWEDPVMQDEIFGPIMPVIDYESLSEVVSAINALPKPLALYLFSGNKKIQKTILKEISYGCGCINDTLLHFASPYLPFGGVGNSGMGSYHGKASFDTFSHRKSILKNDLPFDFPLRYPPYRKLNLLKKIMR